MGEEIDHVIVIITVFLTQVVFSAVRERDQEIDRRLLLQQIARLSLGHTDPDRARHVPDREGHLGPQPTSFPVAIIGYGGEGGSMRGAKLTNKKEC